MSYFLILIKAYSIFVCTHFTWFFCPFPRLVMSGKISTLHSGQSLPQFIPQTHNLCHCLWWALSTLTVCHQSTTVHLGPRLESWPIELWVTYWSVPLTLRSLLALREILDPIKRGYHLYLLFVQPYILCLSNSKGQIKDVKIWKDGLKVMACPKTLGRKEKWFSHIRGLSQSPKVYLNLEGS